MGGFIEISFKILSSVLVFHTLTNLFQIKTITHKVLCIPDIYTFIIIKYNIASHVLKNYMLLF